MSKDIRKRFRLRAQEAVCDGQTNEFQQDIRRRSTPWLSRPSGTLQTQRWVQYPLTLPVSPTWKLNVYWMIFMELQHCLRIVVLSITRLQFLIWKHHTHFRGFHQIVKRLGSASFLDVIPREDNTSSNNRKADLHNFVTISSFTNFLKVVHLIYPTPSESCGLHIMTFWILENIYIPDMLQIQWSDHLVCWYSRDTLKIHAAAVWPSSLVALTSEIGKRVVLI